MGEIKASDVSKLRQMTGAGMMDCKKALTESNGDLEKAIQIVRERGQAIANKRADREASEGAVIAKVSENSKRGAMIVLNCETDFVAKNKDFLNLANKIANAAVEGNPGNLNELKKIEIEGRTIENLIIDTTGITGEKLDLTYYEKVEARSVTAYIHPGNRLATLVGLNKENVNEQVGKDVAMQVAAMSPVSVDKEDVPADVVKKELEIGREQARLEGKPENMLDKIAAGKLQKFYKESTLLNQDYIKDNKKTIKQYLQEADKDLTITEFKRYTLNI